MAYGDLKDLARRTATDNVLKDKAFNIVKTPIYDGYQGGLDSVVYKIFNKNSTGRGVNFNVKSSEQLAKELHKAITRKF